jgi:hypothetical protein
MPARLRKNAPVVVQAPATPRRPYLEDAVAPVPTVSEQARKAASDLGSFFQSLSWPDRWAAGATAALLLMLALPWRWTRQDEEIIGLVAAWPVLLLGSAALVFVWLRARKADAAQERMLKVAQLVASGGAAIFTGFFLPWTSQSHALRAVGRSIAIVESSPQVGAYLGLVCAVAALFAAVPGVSEK